MRKVSLPSHESLLPLMEGRVPYHPYSRTSRRAARSVLPKVGTQLHLAWEYYKSRQALGSCDFEAIAHFRPQWPTVDNGWRARRDRLAQLQLIKLATFTRISPSGSECDVWVAKEYMCANTVST